MVEKLLIFLLLLTATQIHAQKTPYLNHDHTWETPFPTVAPSQEKFQNEDVVILQETTNFTIHRNTLITTIKRKVVLQYQTQKGIDDHKTFKLPETIDPAWETHTNKVNREIRPRKLRYFEPQVLYFVARNSKENETKNVMVKDSIAREVQIYNKVPENIFDFYFTLQNLEVGDIVEIEYQLYLPIVEYRSSESDFTLAEEVFSEIGAYDKLRLFFHSDIAKQKSEWNFIYPSNELYIFSFENDATPHNTIYEKKTTTLQWNWKDLAACTDEVGAHLYQELPYFTYYRHNRQYGIWSDYDIEEMKPYKWSFIAYDLYGYRSDNNPFLFKKISKKEKSIDALFAQQKNLAKSNDSLAVLKQIHHYITEEFRYQNDDAFYKGSDNGLERLPEFLRLKTLREISRFPLYKSLLARLDTDFFLCYISDNRIDEIYPSIYRPFVAEHKLYSVRINGEINFILPKSNRYGLFINELPYYMENANVFLIKQTLESRFEPDNTLFWKTRISTEKENKRLSKIVGEVSLEKNSIILQAQQRLTGQFSTLLRPYYLYEEQDPLIPDYFYQNIADFGEYVAAQKSEIDYKTEYPFEANITTTYELQNYLKKEQETYIINLQKWFQYLIEKEFNAEGRDLSYYPAFRFKDQYQYTLTFDKKVNVNIPENQPIHIKNEMGSYVFEIEQLDEITLSLKAQFILSQEKITPTQASQLAEIYKAIESIKEIRIEPYKE